MLFFQQQETPVKVKEEPKVEETPETIVTYPEKVEPVAVAEAAPEIMEVDVDTSVKEEPVEVKEEERTRPNLRERPPPQPKV